MVETVATVLLGVAADTPHWTPLALQAGGSVPRLFMSDAPVETGRSGVLQTSRKYGASLLSAPSASHCMTSPLLVGVVVAESVTSKAFNENEGGVFSTTRVVDAVPDCADTLLSSCEPKSTINATKNIAKPVTAAAILTFPAMRTYLECASLLYNINNITVLTSFPYFTSNLRLLLGVIHTIRNGLHQVDSK